MCCNVNALQRGVKQRRIRAAEGSEQARTVLNFAKRVAVTETRLNASVKDGC